MLAPEIAATLMLFQGGDIENRPWALPKLLPRQLAPVNSRWGGNMAKTSRWMEWVLEESAASEDILPWTRQARQTRPPRMAQKGSGSDEADVKTA